MSNITKAELFEKLNIDFEEVKRPENLPEDEVYYTKYNDDVEKIIEITYEHIFERE